MTLLNPLAPIDHWARSEVVCGIRLRHDDSDKRARWFFFFSPVIFRCVFDSNFSMREYPFFFTKKRMLSQVIHLTFNNAIAFSPPNGLFDACKTARPSVLYATLLSLRRNPRRRQDSRSSSIPASTWSSLAPTRSWTVAKKTPPCAASLSACPCPTLPRACELTIVD